MKFSTQRDDLLAQLQTVARVSSTRSAIQALSGIQVEVAESSIELRATDMNIALRVPLKGEVISTGSAVLPARLFVDIVRSAPTQKLTFEFRSTEQDVELLAGSAAFHIRTLRQEDFPPLPERDSGEQIEVAAQPFIETVQMVALAASRDETRPVLTGVVVSASDRELRMVATDSYRLAIKETPLETALSGSFEANVPARALQELARIVQQDEAERLLVSVRDNQVVFSVSNTMLSSRLIDGQFPNYRQLLPESYDHELRFSGAELIEVVRRISLLAQRNAPLRLAFTAGELTISARTPDVGEASEALPVPFSGEPFEIGFNPDFLRDGLEVVEAGDVIFKLISPGRPGLIQGADDGGFQYLLMPLRLNV